MNRAEGNILYILFHPVQYFRKVGIEPFVRVLLHTLYFADSSYCFSVGGIQRHRKRYPTLPDDCFCKNVKCCGHAHAKLAAHSVKIPLQVFIHSYIYNEQAKEMSGARSTHLLPLKIQNQAKCIKREHIEIWT